MDIERAKCQHLELDHVDALATKYRIWSLFHITGQAWQQNERSPVAKTIHHHYNQRGKRAMVLSIQILKSSQHKIFKSTVFIIAIKIMKIITIRLQQKQQNAFYREQKNRWAIVQLNTKAACKKYNLNIYRNKCAIEVACRLGHTHRCLLSLSLFR